MLDPAEITVLLRGHGVAGPAGAPSVEPLGGGISGDVALVTWGDERLVVKQPRERLDVAAEWRIDPGRVFNEARALTYLSSILPPGSVPSVRFVDAARCLFAMSVAPAGGAIWKDQLLAGTVSADTAGRVGALLADVHRISAEDPAVATAFGAVELLEQGRIDPYHRTAAARNPELAEAIGAEIRRLQSTRLALVLGDVAPKNIFAYPDHVMFFDVEIAHWGDPAFDVAFCLTHLVVKAIVMPNRATQILDVAAELWRAYRRGVPAWHDHERHVLAELGCLLLARIDGKSPLEYVDDDATRATVRALAARVLLAPPASLADLLAGLRTTPPGRPVAA